MTSAKNESALPIVLLCLAAGYIDATGYLQQQVFAANMTGNTVLAGISLAEREWVTALERASTLLAFFGGAAIGGVLMSLRGRAGRFVLWIEAALLAVACALDPSQPTWLLLTVTAMGMQATVLVSYRHTSVSTVVLTNTMAKLAQSLAGRVVPHSAARPEEARPESGPLAMTWVLYFVGAAIGALIDPYLKLSLIPGAALVIVAAAVEWHRASRR